MIIHRFISAQRVTLKKIWNRILLTGVLAFLVGGLSGCGSDTRQKNEIVVFLAASLQEAMQEVADSFQAEHGIAVRLNFAGSGSLAQQIVAGGQADVFISASKNWIDKVSSLGLTAKGSVVPLLSNSIVIIAHESVDWELDSIEQLGALPFRYLVVGDPDFVPAGKYAKQFLQSIPVAKSESSLWDSLDDRICPTSDLRRVLALVESDRSLVGMVYATDVLKSERVRVIYHVPSDEVSVDYFMLNTSSKDEANDRTENAARFVDYVSSETISLIFSRYGFIFEVESQ